MPPLFDSLLRYTKDVIQHKDTSIVAPVQLRVSVVRYIISISKPSTNNTIADPMSDDMYAPLSIKINHLLHLTIQYILFFF